MSNDAKEDAELEHDDETKIFFCSRTHSQLNQFTTELRKVKLSPIASLHSHSISSDRIEIVRGAEEVRQVALGSRKNLCINHRVSRLGSATAINERCSELQQPSTPMDKRCQYLPRKENEGLSHEFRDHTLARIRDIEDMGQLGKKIGICPYYASRSAVGPSEVRAFSPLFCTVAFPTMMTKLNYNSSTSTGVRINLILNGKDHCYDHM